MTNSHATINAQNASTTIVMVGLKKNMTGINITRVSESNTVPKSWPVKKFRTFQISFMSLPIMPT